MSMKNKPTTQPHLTRQARDGNVSARFVLTARDMIAARIARTGCRFACVELPAPSPYCPMHHTTTPKGA
jgi:hypothetical protein